MGLLCGTSGFSFKEWKGPFYPEKLPAGEMLEYYAGRLPTVEINNTFYRMPRTSVLEGWRDKVPETFRFAIKAPRRISHSKQLKDCAEEARYLFDALQVLGERLGIVLVQLPPHARIAIANLESFLDLIPAGLRVAFEFRHPSWRDGAVFETLASRNAAWVTADNDGIPPADLPATARFTYLRLRAPSYTDEALRAWKAHCAPFEHAFVYFKHEDGGAGPRYAERMQTL